MKKLLLILSIIIPLVLLLIIGSYLTGFLTTVIEDNETGLVAVWHLNEGSGSTTSDSSGNNNDGTINGSTWVDGNFGKALKFDGVNDYVEVPNSASLNITDEITITFWTKQDPTSNFEKQIIGKGLENTGTRTYGITTPYGSLGARFIICNTTDCSLCTYKWTDSNWHHVAGTYNGSHMKIYVDGIERDSVYGNCLIQGPIQSSGRPVQLGAWKLPSGGSSYFNGTIDEAAIYNRVLSESEIQNHYDKGMGEEPIPPGCGNNIKENGEECDGTDDSACPGECLSNCTCYEEPEPPPSPGEGEYSDISLNVKPTSVTDSQAGEVVTITTDEYDLIVDWSVDRYVDFKIKPKFTTDFIRYKRTKGTWSPGTSDQDGNNLDDVVDLNIGAWGRNGNVAWFYENCSEYSLNHTFTFYRDYIELNVHYKPGTKNVSAGYFVGFYNSIDSRVGVSWGKDSTTFAPGVDEFGPSSHGKGGWYPKGYFFAPVFDWRATNSDIGVEWGYNTIPSFIYSPHWSGGYSYHFGLIFTSTNSAGPHKKSGTEEDFHMFVRPYQGNDGKKRGYAYGYAQWIGPKLAEKYEHHNTPIFPLTFMKMSNWDAETTNWVKNSEIKVATYGNKAYQINWNYATAQYAEPLSWNSTPEELNDSWELWHAGPGIPLTGVGGKAIVNPIVPEVRHNLIYEHPYPEWFYGSRGLFWDEVNLAYIDANIRRDHHYYDDSLLEGYLKLIQESRDSGNWEYIMVNSWWGNLHTCYVADACSIEGYWWSTYGWAPNFVSHVHSVTKFVSQMPPEHRPRFIVYQDYDASKPRDRNKAYRAIVGAAKYGFHITLNSFAATSYQLPILNAAERLFKRMGCTRDDDSCIFNNTKRNEFAALDLNNTGTLSTPARMVLFMGRAGIVGEGEIYKSDVTLTSNRNNYTFSNFANETIPLKLTFPFNRFVYPSNTSEMTPIAVEFRNTGKTVFYGSMETLKMSDIVKNNNFELSPTNSVNVSLIHLTADNASFNVSGSGTFTTKLRGMILESGYTWVIRKDGELITDWSYDAVDKILTFNGTTSNATYTIGKGESDGCIESWTCSDWSDCIDGTQTRTCTDANNCGTELEKPSTTQECQSCVESWLCSDWSDCVDNIQTRTCSDQNGCGTFEYKPNETQDCEEIEQIEDILPQIIPAAPTYYSGVSSGGAAGPSGLALSGGKVETETKPQVRIFGPMSFDYDLPIHRIDLTPLKDLTNSRIIVEDSGTITPKEMKPPNTIVYRYIELSTVNLNKDDISDIKISFKVEQSFYEIYDLDISQTKLMRYNTTSNEWNTLSTQKVSTLGDYHFFESTPNELSFYAITTLPTGAVGLGLPLTWVIVIIIVIVFIIIIVKRTRI